MSAWLVPLIITTAVSGIVGAILKFWGTALWHTLQNVITAVAWGTSRDLNMAAEQEYRKTITATIDALKEKIILLEKWRIEAQLLGKRVDDLEQQVRDVRRESLRKDDEIITSMTALNKAKRELANKELDIANLTTSLAQEKNTVLEMQALMAENQLKISALLFQAKRSTEKSDKQDRISSG